MRGWANLTFRIHEGDIHYTQNHHENASRKRQQPTTTQIFNHYSILLEKF